MRTFFYLVKCSQKIHKHRGLPVLTADGCFPSPSSFLIKRFTIKGQVWFKVEKVSLFLKWCCWQVIFIVSLHQLKNCFPYFKIMRTSQRTHLNVFLLIMKAARLHSDGTLAFLHNNLFFKWRRSAPLIFHLTTLHILRNFHNSSWCGGKSDNRETCAATVCRQFAVQACVVTACQYQLYSRPPSPRSVKGLKQLGSRPAMCGPVYWQGRVCMKW